MLKNLLTTPFLLAALVVGPSADARGSSHGSRHSGGGHSSGHHGGGGRSGSHHGGGGHHGGGHSGGQHSGGHHSGGRHSGSPGTHSSHHSSGKHRSTYDSGATRDSHGRIKRSEAAKREFEKETGYPHGRPGYVIDHIKPLADGGADDPSNMEWQTVAEAKAKDKWERGQTHSASHRSHRHRRAA